MVVDTGCHAVMVGVVDRCSQLIGLCRPMAECRRRVLQRVTRRKTSRRVARAPGRRLAPLSVSRFMLALKDSAAALSALVPTAPRDRTTPNSPQSNANSFDAYWAPLSLWKIAPRRPPPRVPSSAQDLWIGSGRDAEGVRSRMILDGHRVGPRSQRGSGRHARAQRSERRRIHRVRLPDRRDRPRGCPADARRRVGSRSQHSSTRPAM